MCMYIYSTVCTWADENNNKPCWSSLETIPQTQPATNMYIYNGKFVNLKSDEIGHSEMFSQS